MCTGSGYQASTGSMNLISGIGLGIQGVGTLTGALAQSSSSKAYADYVKAMSQSALNNYEQQVSQINLRYRQEAEAIGAQAQEIAVQNMQAKATAQASAATSGVEGTSIDNLFKNYDRATAVSNYTAARNLDMLEIQSNNQIDAYRLNALSSVYGLSSTSISSLTPLSTILTGTGSLLSSYSSWYNQSNKAANYR